LTRRPHSESACDPAGPVRLSRVPVGGVVRLHDAQLDADSRSQLRALGLTDGSLLRVCKQGEPCVVRVRTTRIGISGRVAQRLFVLAAEAPVGGGRP
jgi:Fe2+ transport system protein FeoA